MAPSSSSSSSSSSSPSPTSKSPSSPLPPPHHLRHFTPIKECDREEEEEVVEEEYNISEEERSHTTADTKTKTTCAVTSNSSSPQRHHHPTPLHEKKRKPNTTPKQDFTNWVSCNKCRPHPRDKISVVPLDNPNGLSKHHSTTTTTTTTTFSNIPSPNALFKSILSSFTKKSPKSSTADIITSTFSREEQWKITMAELTHKLIQTTRRRDEAVLESSKLKHSISELEKKLNKLEVYCHNLKSGLEECSINNNNNNNHSNNFKGKSLTQQEVNGFMGVINEKVIENFLVCVGEARSNIRLLSRSLTMQLRHVGGKAVERLSLLLQPYDVKATSLTKNPKSVVFYLEALLNKVFFEDFEAIGFQKSSVSPVLNPIDRCEENYESFNVLKELTWEEVLSKGTRHFSEEFSKFCDRKMSEIVAMLGWNRAWPEPLLQAFFGASKSVWLVHLLANSVHPSLPIFRVDKWVSFDPVYMEDMGGGDRAKKLVPTMVRIMVAPGFYVYDNVVKCKVLCRYYNNNNYYYYNTILTGDKGLTPSP